MEIEFLGAGEGPELGKFSEGEKRDLEATLAKLLIQRGLARAITEIKIKKEPVKAKMEE